MIKEVLKKLKLLINFGIDENEQLTREEKALKSFEFRKSVNCERYMDLFNQIQMILLSDNVSPKSKEKLIIVLIEFIRLYPKIENDVNSLPTIIQLIYSSEMELIRLMILLENIFTYEVPDTKEFTMIILDYYEFLENPNNEFFIHNQNTKIQKFNKNIELYLNKKDLNNIEFSKSFDPALLDTLNSRLTLTKKMKDN